ncbi:MAG TPA: heme o synthase [Terriglobales bacterium]|nr:heme o synthase [Terriglobales bacterium]
MSAALQTVPNPEQLNPSTRPESMRRYSRLGDFAVLLKMRVTSLVVMTAWAGYYLGVRRALVPAFSWKMLCALLGIGLVSGGAAALNQVIEREADGQMRRTQQRPIPGNRMGVVEAGAVGIACIFAGAAYLAFTTNPITGILSVLTASAYVGVYTPLKKYSPLCTTIGALPGAMPPLLGWTAARGRVEWEALVLFAILFLWQFPHFHAIAWMYREDYRRAGIRMLPVVEEDGRSTVREVLAYSMMLVPVSLFPGYLHMVGKAYIVGALALGLAFLVFSIRFARVLSGIPAAESRKLARALLRASVLYLPALFALMMISAKLTSVQ